ncbi:MAG: TRAP transporter large permease subunit [Rhodoferax sp.]|nr:TRAP transporter large permease subunit [Rhodoferax sp.]
MTAASIFAWLLTTTQAAQMLAEWILSITRNKWAFLCLANLLIHGHTAMADPLDDGFACDYLHPCHHAVVATADGHVEVSP